MLVYTRQFLEQTRQLHHAYMEHLDFYDTCSNKYIKYAATSRS